MLASQHSTLADWDLANIITMVVGVLAILGAIWRVAVGASNQRTDIKKLTDRVTESEKTHVRLEERDLFLSRENTVLLVSGAIIAVALLALAFRNSERIKTHERWHIRRGDD